MFIWDAEASYDALGSVLSQVQNGQEKVIGCYSKCFNKAERRYCTKRKEFVAVVSSIKHWHHCLYGRHFKVHSDHGSLRWIINLKICEGALAKILETLAIYDFEIEFRQGSRHTNADSLSRRPCSDQECAHSERFEKRYNKETNPRFATRNTGLLSEESVKQGESQLTVKIERGSEQKLKGYNPSDDCKLSMYLEQGPLQTQCSLKETECLSTGGNRQDTSPTQGDPKVERERSVHKTETKRSQRITENSKVSHGCNFIRVNNKK